MATWRQETGSSTRSVRDSATVHATGYLLRSIQLVKVERVAYVVLGNGQKLRYEVVASGTAGEGSDCAILKVDIRNAPALKIGDSTRVMDGNQVMVIGFPAVADGRGLLDEQSRFEPSVTKGMVSAVKRAETGEPLIQVSAPIHHGNSGGPAIDRSGAVIGIATFGNEKEVQGFNWLVASETLNALLERTHTRLAASETQRRWEEALTLYWDDDYAGAISKLEEVQRLFPAHVDAQRLLTRALQDRHNDSNRSRGSSGLVLVIVAACVTFAVLAAFVNVRRRTGAGARLSIAITSPPDPSPLVADDIPSELARSRQPQPGPPPRQAPRTMLYLVSACGLGLVVGTLVIVLLRSRGGSDGSDNTPPLPNPGNEIVESDPTTVLRASDGAPDSQQRSSNVAAKTTSGTEIRPRRTTASTNHPPSAGYTYGARNVSDGRLGTSWQPAKGVPQWVRLDLGDEFVVTSVSVANGFQTEDRFGDEFLLNSRIAHGRIRFSDNTEIPVSFASSKRGFIEFHIDHKNTTSITLVVDEVFHGTRWHDLAVSEIRVEGIRIDPD